MLTEINDAELGAERIGHIQSGILRKVYTEEYPSSVCSASKAIEDVKDGVQRVIFWGKDMGSLANADGWTVALVKSDMPWLIEMCRAGASVNTGEGLVAVRKMLNHFLDAESDHDTLFVTTRNCEARAATDGTNIEGWEAIFAIFNRIKGFSFLWHAPWYVMPWNKVEFLDIRAYHRNRPKVCDFLGNTPLWIASGTNREYARSLLRNGYAIDPIVPDHMPEMDSAERSDLSEFHGKFEIDVSEHGKRNTLLFVPEEESETVRPLRDFLSRSEFPIKTVRIDLTKRVPRHALLQTALERNWFVFTGMIPSETHCYGFWSKIESSVMPAAPIYVGKESVQPIQLQSELYARHFG